MGNGRGALFPREKGERGEGRNWVATFTRAGCVACKSEEGELNHKGRGGGPILMIMGDEGIPTVVGYTKKGEDQGCAWVFKKEFLALEEVGEILKKLDVEKKIWDREGDRRAHEFFIPNGSKILVGSYVQLRRDGVDKYVEGFNNMVRDVFRVTGDVGIEVLPYVPVMYENMDKVGRECLTGLANWVEWVGGVKGRESIKELAKTAGNRTGDDLFTVQYSRTFASMRNRMWEGENEGEWKLRGNRLDLVKGGRLEVQLRTLEPAREIGGLMRGREGGDCEEERRGRESTDFGVSVESEYTFTTAISRFTRMARNEEYYLGGRIRNVREQMAMRARFEGQGRLKKYVVAVGASEMVRLMEEVERLGEQVLMVGPKVRVKGEWNEEKMMRVLEELENCEVTPDTVLVFGPGNCLVEHGKKGSRGLGGEVKLIMEGEGRIRTEYHLTEPIRRMTEERDLMVGMVHGLMRGIKKLCGGTEVVYIGLLPRHVEVCCKEEGHMRVEDAGAMHMARREFDQAVKGRLGEDFRVWEWGELLGVGKEVGLREVKEKRMLSRDGVHLDRVWNRRMAANLCCRLVDEAVVVREEIVVEGEKKGKEG
jgi:hypothetical protein